MCSHGGWSLAEEPGDDRNRAAVERGNMWARGYGAWTSTSRLLVTPHLRAALAGRTESPGRRNATGRASVPAMTAAASERIACVRDGMRHG